MYAQKDLYEILQVHPSASPEEIFVAYHRLSLIDIEEIDELFDDGVTEEDVAFAYYVLSDPERRAEYDAARMQPRNGPTRINNEERARRDAGPSAATRSVPSGRRETRWLNLGTSRANGKLEHLGVSTHDLHLQRHTFGVRFINGKLEFRVNWKTEVSFSPTIEVNYQIDGGEIHTGEWQVYVSAGKMVFMYPTKDQISEMYDSDKLKVWVHPFGGSEMIATFGLEGFRDAVLPVLGARDTDRSSRHNPADKVAGGTTTAIAGLATTTGLLGIAAALMHYFGGGAEFFMIGMIIGVGLAVPLVRKSNQTARFLWNHRGLFYGASVALLLIAYNPGESGIALVVGIPLAIVVYAFVERNRQPVGRRIWNVVSYVTLITLAAAAMVMFLDHTGKNKKS